MAAFFLYVVMLGDEYEGIIMLYIIITLRINFGLLTSCIFETFPSKKVFHKSSSSETQLT